MEKSWIALIISPQRNRNRILDSTLSILSVLITSIAVIASCSLLFCLSSLFLPLDIPFTPSPLLFPLQSRYSSSIEENQNSALDLNSESRQGEEVREGRMREGRMREGRMREGRIG